MLKSSNVISILTSVLVTSLSVNVFAGPETTNAMENLESARNESNYQVILFASKCQSAGWERSDGEGGTHRSTLSHLGISTCSLTDLELKEGFHYQWSEDGKTFEISNEGDTASEEMTTSLKASFSEPVEGYQEVTLSPSRGMDGQFSASGRSGRCMTIEDAGNLVLQASVLSEVQTTQELVPCSEK